MFQEKEEERDKPLTKPQSESVRTCIYVVLQWMEIVITYQPVHAHYYNLPRGSLWWWDDKVCVVVVWVYEFEIQIF